MRRWIAMLLIATLLLTTTGCTGGEIEPTVKETLPGQTQTTAPTDKETIPKETEATEPAVPSMVTVYLLEKTVIFDSGYQLYNYDENNNILSIETFTIEDALLYKTHFSKQDANGMFCQSVEEWDEELNRHTFVWFQDGKLQEEQYDPGFSGDQYEYDPAGRVSQMRNYYDGILNYTVYFGYDGDALQRVYCENEEGRKLFECEIENGRIVKKNLFDIEGTIYYAYEYIYDDNGNLNQRLFTMDGETSPCEIHTYRAVEVDANLAYYLMAQQQYLLDMNHAG